MLVRLMTMHCHKWRLWIMSADSRLFNVPWWRHQMEIFSTLLAFCAGNSPVTCEFPSQRPLSQRFHVFVDLCLNKRLSKQSWGWWYETTSSSLWRHCNDDKFFIGSNKSNMTCLLTTTLGKHIDGLAQDCSKPNALAKELLQSCAKPSIYTLDKINRG